MFMFASLSLLVLLSGILLSWKNIQDSSNELALYGTKQPSDPGKPEENPLSWLGSVFDSFFKFHTEELSLHGLLKARKHLQERGQLSELLDKCLVYVMEALDHEPSDLWENARLTLHCDRTLLVFVSGKGESEMAMFEFEGKIYYKAKASSWQTFFTRALRRYL